MTIGISVSRRSTSKKAAREKSKRTRRQKEKVDKRQMKPPGPMKKKTR